MTAEAQCLPFLPTILSLSITIFMGLIALVIHLSSDQKPPKVVPVKTKSRSTQTSDTEAQAKKQTASIARQLEHQKVVVCNLEEENEGLTQQVETLKHTSDEQKAEIRSLKEQLKEANERCEQLSVTIKKLQIPEKDETSEKKSDAEFQNAMAMLLDLAEQSVNREIRNVSGSKKPQTMALNAEEFSPEDWTFMLNLAALSENGMKEVDNVDVKVVSRQQHEAPGPHLLFNEPSPRTPDVKKASGTLPSAEKAMDGLVLDSLCTSAPSAEKSPMDGELSSLVGVLTSEENLSPDPNDAKENSTIHLTPLNDVNLDEPPSAHSWASQCNTPCFSEVEHTFNPNAKPFIPKRQQLQEEVQKRLQQWKEFYYTQVQPQEVVTQQQPLPETAASQHCPAGASGHQTMKKWMDKKANYPQYYPPQLEWDQAQVPEGSYSSYQDSWDQSPLSSEVVSEDTWPEAPPAPQDGVWMSHQPYTYHCQCTSCLYKQVYQSTTQQQPIASGGSRCHLQLSLEDGEQLGGDFTNATIGLSFRFPPISEAGAEQWELASETCQPFYVARFTPIPEIGCQLVVTEEYLQPTRTLQSYVELSKQQTEETLAAYDLVCQSERLLMVCESEAIEVVYVQESEGDMLVWSLCILTFGRVLTLQIVAANGTKAGIMNSLPDVVKSIQLAAPQTPSQTYAARRLQRQWNVVLQQRNEACMTIQRAVRCWLARRVMEQLRSQQTEQELAENDVFIRVQTRINPKFFH